MDEYNEILSITKIILAQNKKAFEQLRETVVNGYNELEKRIDAIENRIDNIEKKDPLYNKLSKN